MSLTKQYIEELHDRAAQGDDEARRSLERAGLWTDTEEQARLWEIIKDQRHVIQRLQFPAIYSPNCPLGAEETARQIYTVAAHIVELMRREGMQDNYEVTYNSMVEIASFAQPLCGVSNE